MKELLIVEDEDMLRKIYTTLFELEKFKVHKARNGYDAVEKLKSITPDVILLDLLMPVMNGFEFLEAVNIKTSHPHTKVLVLSNLSDQASLDKIKELGASKYVLKSSISPSELVSEVRSLL